MNRYKKGWSFVISDNMDGPTGIVLSEISQKGNRKANSILLKKLKNKVNEQ